MTYRLLKLFPPSDAFKLPELFTLHTPGNHSLNVHSMTLIQPAEKDFTCYKGHIIENRIFLTILKIKNSMYYTTLIDHYSQKTPLLHILIGIFSVSD